MLPAQSAIVQASTDVIVSDSYIRDSDFGLYAYGATSRFNFVRNNISLAGTAQAAIFANGSTVTDGTIQANVVNGARYGIAVVGYAGRSVQRSEFRRMAGATFCFSPAAWFWAIITSSFPARIPPEARSPPRRSNRPSV